MVVTKFISVFNNKGGVGKTTLSWNLADALGKLNRKVLIVDFDPQCNLSIAVLGATNFQKLLDPVAPSGTIRRYLQGFLQNTPQAAISLQSGEHTSENVKIVPGDFWLNVFADSLNVGNDVLTGTGIAKFVAIRKMVSDVKNISNIEFDAVIIDLPPSFGTLVRSAMYSSDYLVIPCTSDTFSVYCVSLIAQMLPQFIRDWDTGLQRFKQSNYGSTDFDGFGKPQFLGWIFNGFDTRANKVLRADQAHQVSIQNAIENLISVLKSQITHYDAAPVAASQAMIGAVEDMNVLVQNSLWQSIPASSLDAHKQVKDLTGNRVAWSVAQQTLIGSIKTQIDAIAGRVNAVL